MSNYSAERLYRLLPALHRLRDADQGYPLRDLVTILAGQAEVLEADIQQLYENWFVETCEPWVVPYLGDLLGVRGTRGAASRRAEVANTLPYRQAKGTLAVTERLARDVTGWPARAVESFQLLGTTQYVKHVRLANLRTPDLRRASDLELLSGPFETAAHTAEVRRIAVEAGRYNIQNLGIFLWRLQAYPLAEGMPHPVTGSFSTPQKHFTWNPLGMDQQLFSSGGTAAGSRVASELDVPGPIRRRALYDALARYYGSGLSLAVWTSWDPALTAQDPLPADQVAVCDLTQWKTPSQVKVAVDPLLGRLSFQDDQDPGKVRVSYHYGFSDDLGGGTYERQATFTRIAGETYFAVSETASPELQTLQGALGEWKQALALGPVSAVIEIRDSRTYAEHLKVPEIPSGHRLEIRAANRQRPTLLLTTEIKVTGAAESSFEMNGLLVAGRPVRLAGQLNHALFQHTTLAPADGTPVLIVEPGGAQVTIERSIVGAVRASYEAHVDILDSIVDAGDGTGRALLPAYAAPDGKAPGGALTVSRSTVIGAVRTGTLALAENSLFLHPVRAERRQEGCVRFCSLAAGSRVPRRFHCQPAVPDGSTADEARRLAALLSPRFTALRYGDPGYCQLTADTPREIRRGAEDESEMGVFSSLLNPQREDALRLRLEEYLRVGLEAGIFYAT
ncbi:MAG TPA: hypothetical protein VFE33_09735 [Thermoanaerobaculia bacterium]|nr:hypothetical protein [Thermoanaerobaculia bacterium]